MKWLTLLLAVFVTGVFSSEVIFSEDFEGTKFPPEGWSKEQYGYSYWRRAEDESRNFYAEGYTADGRATYLYTPNIYSASGQKIKVSFRYRYIDRYYLTAKIVLGRYSKNPFSTTSGWWKYSFVVSGPINSNMYFYLFGEPSFGGGLDIDDVEVKKCFTTVEPNSLGKIKALYN